jgi:hypothetical protein
MRGKIFLIIWHLNDSWLALEIMSMTFKTIVQNQYTNDIICKVHFKAIGIYKYKNSFVSAFVKHIFGYLSL